MSRLQTHFLKKVKRELLGGKTFRGGLFNLVEAPKLKATKKRAPFDDRVALKKIRFFFVQKNKYFSFLHRVDPF